MPQPDTQQLDIQVDPPLVAINDEFTVAIGTPQLFGTPSAQAAFVVALDASLSMTAPALGPDGPGPTRWDLARDGALALLEEIPDDAYVHVLLFATRATVVVDGPAGELRGRLAAALPARPADESTQTDIEAALSASYGLLAGQRATSRTVVLLTDGEPNLGKTRPEHLEALAGAAADQDIYTRPIGFGADAKIDLLLKISSDGSADHITTGAEARDTMTAFMRRLGAAGRDAVASGGRLTANVSPFFTVTGVYQLAPSRQRLERVSRTMPDDSTTVTLRLGAVGAGDDRPVFALRLRAPGRSNQAPVTVLRCSGVIRTARGEITLADQAAEVRLTVEGQGPVDGQAMEIIKGIDLDAEVRQQAAFTDKSQFISLYAGALQQAEKEGLSEQIELYESTLENLRGGANPSDEYSRQQSLSSRSATRPQDLLLNRPAAIPRPRAAPAVSAAFDGEDDDTYTQPGGPW